MGSMLGPAGLINVSGAARFHVEHAHLTTDLNCGLEIATLPDTSAT
jgi:hypothetical protein